MKMLQQENNIAENSERNCYKDNAPQWRASVHFQKL